MSVILLVEDFAPLRESTALALRAMGHRVLEAGSGESAMAHLLEERIDCLFTDVALPGMSGDVLAAEACALQPRLKVVFGTGLNHFGPQAGPDDPPILRKPYSHDSLRAAFDGGSPCA